MKNQNIAFQKNILIFVVQSCPLTVKRREEIEPYYRNKRSEACGDGGVSYL